MRFRASLATMLGIIFTKFYESTVLNKENHITLHQHADHLSGTTTKLFQLHKQQIKIV